MTDETPISRFLRERLPSRGYPLDGPRAGGITRFADDAKINRASASRIIGGNGGASEETLRKIAQFFDLSFPELMDILDRIETGKAGHTDNRRGQQRPLAVHDGRPRDPEPLSDDEFWSVVYAGGKPATPPGGWSPYPAIEAAERALWESGFDQFGPGLSHEMVWSGKLAAIQAWREKNARLIAEEARKTAQR